MLKWLSWLPLRQAVVSLGVVALLGFGGLPAAAESSPEAIVNRLLQANQLPSSLVTEVAFSEKEGLNAYTNGEGIYITRDLWNRLPGDEERAFVMSHELAHVYLNHVEKMRFRGVGLGLLSRLFARVFGGGLSSTAAQVGLGLVDKKFSRNAEYQADELGLNLMRKANYNPRAALTVFEVLQQASAGGRAPEFLSSHPMPQSRIQALLNQKAASSFTSTTAR